MIETGLMKVISDIDYHEDTTRISKSGLDLIAKSPLHYWNKYLNPDREKQQPTAALIFGKAVHTAVLEPHEFSARYVIMPDLDRRTKEGKAAYKEFIELHAGKEIISADDYNSCMRISESVHKHDAASFLLEQGITESSVFFDEPITGAPCKIRPDFYNTKADVIVDLKTTEDASAESFGRSSLKYRYHVQAPFYADGMEHAGIAKPMDFIFIAVEKTPPYAVAVYNVPDAIFDLGREVYLRDLDVYMRCRREGIWEGYDKYITDLQFPAFAFRK